MAVKWEHTEDELLPTRQELAEENKKLKEQLKAQEGRTQLVEDCVAEIAKHVYSV